MLQSCYVSSLVSTWVLAFCMEVPDTRWSCNGTELHHIICPGARRAHPALPLRRWKTPDSICSEPWMTQGVGDGVSWVLEWSKRGLKHLGRCLKEKSRRKKKKRKGRAFSLPTISWGFTGFPTPTPIFKHGRKHHSEGESKDIFHQAAKTQSVTPLLPETGGGSGVLSQSPEINWLGKI